MGNQNLGFSFGISRVSEDGPCYVIAEIGHNHQGNLETALKMIRIAAECGVQAVKFQKRENKVLFTKALYDRPYDNENSYGSTYGLHRERLEFGKSEWEMLKKCAHDNNVELLATAFDFPSVDFMEELGITAYKVASGDVTNTPLLTYIAKLGKPMFISTGAATMDEVKIAYEAVLKYNHKICLLHCSAAYPARYEQLNLRVISTFKKEYPQAIIGYSGHDNGILGGVIASLLGAGVIEKHFTLDRSWKGTDHNFSLEPIGMRKQVRDLQRLRVALGDGKKMLNEFEKDARVKMGKGIYTRRTLPAGVTLTGDDLFLKSPGNGIPPYRINEVIGRKLRTDLGEEVLIVWDHLD